MHLSSAFCKKIQVFLKKLATNQVRKGAKLPFLLIEHRIQRHIVSQKLSTTAALTHQIQDIAHAAGRAKLSRGIPDKTVSDTAVMAKGRLIFWKMRRYILDALRVMSLMLPHLHLPVSIADFSLPNSGKTVGNIHHLLNTMQIGVSVVSHTDQQDRAAHLAYLAVTAIGVAGRHQPFLARNESLDPIGSAEHHHGMAGMQ